MAVPSRRLPTAATALALTAALIAGGCSDDDGGDGGTTTSTTEPGFQTFVPVTPQSTAAPTTEAGSTEDSSP